MSSRAERACDLFSNKKFHCSQAVFAAFADDLGMSEEQALKLTACFGGGMRNGEVCGCAIGALMAVGHKYGQTHPDDLESRQKANEATVQFMNEFKDAHGSYLCKDLLEYDFAIPEEAKHIFSTKLVYDVCPKLITSAVEIAEKIRNDVQ